MSDPCECCGQPGKHMMEWDEWLCSECAAQAVEDDLEHVEGMLEVVTITKCYTTAATTFAIA